MWYVLLVPIVLASCPNYWPPMLVGDYDAYMFRLDGYHPEMAGCFHFFNETTICFADQWPRDYMHEDVRIAEIEANRIVSQTDCEPLSDTRFWHLHDVSHRTASMREYVDFCYQSPLPETTVYVLDTYMDVDHPEFEGRARLGKQVVPGTSRSLHGTHVGALVGGRRVGVNKKAKIVSVQVLNDDGFGSWQEIIAGLEWVAQQSEKGVINLSISGARSDMINEVVNKMARRGFKIVVAAGNDNQDACNYSPASAKYAITVGAVARQNKWAGFSNYGRCVDLLAPGDTIGSALPNRQYGYMSGTSMAAPLVAGVWSSFKKWDATALLSRGGVNRPISGLPSRTTKKTLFNGGEGKKKLRELFSSQKYPILYDDVAFDSFDT